MYKRDYPDSVLIEEAGTDVGNSECTKRGEVGDSAQSHRFLMIPLYCRICNYQKDDDSII